MCHSWFIRSPIIMSPKKIWLARPCQCSVAHPIYPCSRDVTHHRHIFDPGPLASSTRVSLLQRNSTQRELGPLPRASILLGISLIALQDDLHRSSQQLLACACFPFVGGLSDGLGIVRACRGCKASVCWRSR